MLLSSPQYTLLYIIIIIIIIGDESDLWQLHKPLVLIGAILKEMSPYKRTVECLVCHVTGNMLSQIHFSPQTSKTVALVW